MARYTLATALLLFSKEINADHDGHSDDSWSILPTKVPTPLSDMGISLLSTEDGDEVKKRIILTGGCDHPDGNALGDDGYFSCSSISSKAFAFDPIRHSDFQAWNGEFETLADMPRERYRHTSAAVDGKLCVFGGRNSTENSTNDGLVAEVDCYDPAANTWAEVTSLPEKYVSSDFSSYTKGSKVYLIGGYDGPYNALGQVTIVDMSDMSAITYSDGPQLNEKRGDIDVAVVNGDVYVSGGFTHENEWSKPKNTVEKYTDATGKWSDVDSLNKERGDKQLVAIGGKVYALGGEAKVDLPEEDLVPGSRSEVLDSVEVLDPTEDVHGGMAEWRSMAGMPGQLFRFGASEWEVDGGVDGEDEGFIFVFGGQSGYNSDCKCFETSDNVMVFDIAHAQEMMAKTEASSNGAGVANVVLAGAFSLVAAGLALV